MAENMLKWITPVLLGASIIATTAVAQYRLALTEAEIEDLSESIDENEDEISNLTLQQLRELGEMKGDIKLLLRLLQEIKEQNRD